MSKYRTIVCLASSFIVGLVCAIGLGDLSRNKTGPAPAIKTQTTDGDVDRGRETAHRSDDLN